MTTIRATSASIALAACALVASTSALAASTWDVNAFSCGNETNFGNNWSVNSAANCSGSAVVTASAWSATNPNGVMTTAQLRKFGGGFGVSNQQEGLNVAADMHTTDNEISTDLIAFDFGASKIALGAAVVGYIGTNTAGTKDSDISVLAWTGANAPSSLSNALAGKTISGGTGLVANGWTLIGNYADLVLNQSKAINGGANPISSSWWLISAYNSTYNGSAALDTVADYVKILAISSQDIIKKAPEPGTLALAALAVTGLLTMRRKTIKAA